MDKLKEIFSKLLCIDLKLVNDSISRENTEEWDSFNHLLLVSAIEKELGITLTISEVEKIKSFGQLAQIISEKRG